MPNTLTAQERQALQDRYDEMNRRGLLKSNPDAAAWGHEVRSRGLVSDPTEGGAVTPSAPAAPSGLAAAVAGFAGNIARPSQAIQRNAPPPGPVRAHVGGSARIASVPSHKPHVPGGLLKPGPLSPSPRTYAPAPGQMGMSARHAPRNPAEAIGQGLGRAVSGLSNLLHVNDQANAGNHLAQIGAGLLQAPVDTLADALVREGRAAPKTPAQVVKRALTPGILQPGAQAAVSAAASPYLPLGLGQTIDAGKALVNPHGGSLPRRLKAVGQIEMDTPKQILGYVKDNPLETGLALAPFAHGLMPEAPPAGPGWEPVRNVPAIRPAPKARAAAKPAPVASAPPPPVPADPAPLTPPSAPVHGHAPATPPADPRFVENFPTAQIIPDPERFQYKIGYGKGGQSGSLTDVKAYNPDFAGVVHVWRDPADGQTYVVNGHNRHALAVRTGTPGMDVRFIDAKTAAEARTKGALMNVAEGQGTALDAAKLFRDSKMTPEDVQKMGVNLKGQKASQGLALANLNDALFNQALRGEIPVERAALIGEKLPGAGDQQTLMKQIEGRSVTNADLAEMADAIAHGPKVDETTASLFGSDTVTRSLAVERGQAASFVKAQLAQEGAAFGNASKNAGRLAKGNNRIDAEQSAKIALENRQGAELFDSHKNAPGPVADILNDAARRLAAAKDTGESPDAIKRDALTAFQALIPDLARGAADERPGPAASSAPGLPAAPTEPARSLPGDAADRGQLPQGQVAPTLEMHPTAPGENNAARAVDGTFAPAPDAQTPVTPARSAPRPSAAAVEAPGAIPAPTVAELVKPLKDAAGDLNNGPAPDASPRTAFGMKMDDVKAAADRLGISLPDKATFSRPFRDILADAYEHDQEVNQSTPGKVERNPALSNQEYALGHLRLRELTETEIPGLTRRLEAATGDEQGHLQTRLDDAMQDVTHLTNTLYRAGSEAGRRLAFQKAFMGEDISPQAILKRAQAATGGKLSKEGAATLTRLSQKAKTVKAALDAQTDAAAQGAKSPTVPARKPTQAGFGADNKLFTAAAKEEALKRIQSAGTRLNSGVPIDLLTDAATVGGFYVEAGLRKFGDWADQMRQDFGGRFSDADLQHIWANVRAETQRRAANPFPDNGVFVDALAKRLGREGAQGFVNDLAAATGDTSTLQALIDGTLTPEQSAAALKAYRDNAPTRTGRTGPDPLAPLSQIVREARQSMPPRMTAQRATKLAQQSAERMLADMEAGYPARVPAQRSQLVAAGVREYADGARDLAKFGRAMNKRYAEKLPADVLQGVFTEAAQRYRADYAALEAVKKQISAAIAREAYNHASGLEKAGAFAGNVRDLGQTLQTTFDLSFAGRQGGFITYGNPRLAARTWRATVDALKSEVGTTAQDLAIRTRPNAAFGEKSGLHLSDVDGADLTKEEEQFRSRWAEKIPGVGKLVRLSERGNTTLLNKVRADFFDALCRDAQKMNGGKDVTPEQGKALAELVNLGTGRGTPESFGRAVNGMMQPFFGARWVASRFQLLAGKPFYRGDAVTRRLVARTYLQYASARLTLRALGAAAGAKVVNDVRASDFWKMHFGNLVVDLSDGFDSILTMGARMFTGQTVTQAGRVQALDGTGPGGIENTRLGVGMRFYRGKLGPVPSALVTAGLGKDYMGQPATALGTKENLYLDGQIQRLILPMTVPDVVQAARQEGIPAATAVALLNTFGVNASVRQPIGPTSWDGIPDTPATRLMRSALMKRLPGGDMTPAQKAQADSRNGLLTKGRAGGDILPDLLGLLHKGQLKPGQVGRMRHQASEPAIVAKFEALPFADALAVYQAGNVRERAQWLTPMRQKLQGAAGRLSLTPGQVQQARSLGILGR